MEQKMVKVEVQTLLADNKEPEESYCQDLELWHMKRKPWKQGYLGLKTGLWNR